MKRLSLIAILFIFFGCSAQNPSANTALDSTSANTALDSKDSNSALEEFYDHTNMQVFDEILDKIKNSPTYTLSQSKKCQDELFDKLKETYHNFLNSSAISDILGEENIVAINKLFKSDLGVRLEKFLKENNVTLFNISDSIPNANFSAEDYDEFINEIKQNIKVDNITNDFADIKDKLSDNLYDIIKQVEDFKQCFAK